MKLGRSILRLLLVVAISTPLFGRTWYVRPDGGTRYSSSVTSGQCDGKTDGPYGGKDVNQHCAFRDFRYMWDDDSGRVGSGSWVMAGGDTVIIRGCSAYAHQSKASNPDCRIGWDGPTGALSNNWCYGVGSYTCYNPPIPAGTALRHTRILGQNYAACNAGGATNPKTYKSNLTHFFGGFGLTWTFNLKSTQYVDIQCIELTTHNGACVVAGSPQYPRGCSTNQPLDDYAQNGFVTNNATSNVTFQDVYIHGFNSSGLFGPIGGPIIMTRMFIGFNAFAGWNFDDGSSTRDAPGSSIAADHVIMEGNGCYEQYPIVNAFPAQVCYDTNNQGFGDSWSGQDTKLDSFLCDHCVMAYNTKDGFIGPHTLISYLKITNSESYGNMGQQWKWGTPPGSTTIFENNLTVGNCRRMAEPLPGAPPGYNRHLGGFCRAAGDVFSFFTAANSTVLFAGNTTVGYSATMFDLSCQQANTCNSTRFIFRNNIVLGYNNLRNSPSDPPGLFYFSDPSVKLDQDHNLFFNLRSKPCTKFGRPDVICIAPAFVNQPSLTLSSEAQLDNFNFHLTSGSPANGHGVAVSGVTTDYFGNTRPNPPSIGAVEVSR